MSEYSIFQSNPEIRFTPYRRNLELLSSFQCPELETLQWFAQGKYVLEQKGNDTLHFYIVKWGRSDFTKTGKEESFLFYPKLIRTHTGYTVDFIEPHFTGDEFKFYLGMLWGRIWK
jgi:hypothetical protein